jgi:lipopolysaccharide/colanic/teichoic acid biosynthesis glycosyltransferase
MDVLQSLPAVDLNDVVDAAAVTEGPVLRLQALDRQGRDRETARLLLQALPWHEVHPSLSRAEAMVKRCLDILGAAVLMILTSPVLVIAAIAVRLDSPGAAVFAQDRVGRQGRTFRILKLRSMVVDNDDAEHAAYVAKLISGQADHQGGVYKLTRDPRITSVGRFIRRYSIDELPQLWNVLVGDMSLVGPRPALPREVALYDAAARQRLALKPGLTGLWQVSGRCELSFGEMVELDVAYGRSWSLSKDLRILLKTPLAAVSARGAA